MLENGVIIYQMVKVLKKYKEYLNMREYLIEVLKQVMESIKNKDNTDMKEILKMDNFVVMGKLFMTMEKVMKVSG